MKTPAWGPLTDIALICLTVGLFLLTAYHFSTDRMLAVTPDDPASAAASTTRSPDREPTPWQYIVIHHSATSAGSSQRFDRYHRDRWKWEGMAYHFVIGNGRGCGDGVIEAGERWKKGIPGPHTKNVVFNSRSIAVCLVGDFNAAPPTKKQAEALALLITRLQEHFRIPDDRVLVHGDVPQSFTECPGKFLTTKGVRDLIARSRSIPKVAFGRISSK